MESDPFEQPSSQPPGPDDRSSSQASPETGFEEPPENPAGGRTLIVDAWDDACYARPSQAIKEAEPEDQVFVRPGIYEDRIFIADRPIRLLGAGRDRVQIFNRLSGPLYLQRVEGGQITGLTFRYVGSDQHSAINILDSACTLSHCRATEGLLSGIVIYGPQCRPTLLDNEVCFNRESGIFAFAGAHPYLSRNACFGNHHFGIAVRDDGSRPDIVRNVCRSNMLSGILLFASARALILENACHDNFHWGLVTTPECETTPDRSELESTNSLGSNPRGAVYVTPQPLGEIGR